jgi:hypothetical protein
VQKNLLIVLLIMIFVGTSAFATIYMVRTFYDLALLQAEHDLILAYPTP